METNNKMENATPDELLRQMVEHMYRVHEIALTNEEEAMDLRRAIHRKWSKLDDVYCKKFDEAQGQFSRELHAEWERARENPT